MDQNRATIKASSENDRSRRCWPPTRKCQVARAVSLVPGVAWRAANTAAGGGANLDSSRWTSARSLARASRARAGRRAETRAKVDRRRLMLMAESTRAPAPPTLAVGQRQRSSVHFLPIRQHTHTLGADNAAGCTMQIHIGR